LLFDLAQPVKIVGDQADVAPVQSVIVYLAALLLAVSIEKRTEFDVFFSYESLRLPSFGNVSRTIRLNGAGNTLIEMLLDFLDGIDLLLVKRR